MRVRKLRRPRGRRFEGAKRAVDQVAQAAVKRRRALQWDTGTDRPEGGQVEDEKKRNNNYRIVNSPASLGLTCDPWDSGEPIGRDGLYI